MRTIALILGNNDYANVLVAMLESINEAIIWRTSEDPHPDLVGFRIDPDYVSNLLTESIRFHLAAYSFDPQYPQGPFLDYLADAELYFRRKMKILFDDEAEFFISTNDHDYGSYYLTLLTGEIKPIFPRE